jgi:hypothetical protein
MFDHMRHKTTLALVRTTAPPKDGKNCMPDCLNLMAPRVPLSPLKQPGRRCNIAQFSYPGVTKYPRHERLENQTIKRRAIWEKPHGKGISLSNLTVNSKLIYTASKSESGRQGDSGSGGREMAIAACTGTSKGTATMWLWWHRRVFFLGGEERTRARDGSRGVEVKSDLES